MSLKTILFLSAFLLVKTISLNAQTTTIDYSTANNGQCNLFNPSATIGGLQFYFNNS